MTQLKEFLDIIVPTYLQGLQHTLESCDTYTKRIKSTNTITLDTDGDIYRTEQKYHCTGDHNMKLGVDQVLEIFEFNNYIPGYKLLTKRTQDYLFSKCMLAHFPPLDEVNTNSETDTNSDITPLQKIIYQICEAGLIDWLRYCVLTHPDVEAFMKPIADKYVEYNKREITRLDNIPHVEQKTEEWHAIRKNMISASVAGYIDSDACGCNKSHERSKMEEKSGLKSRRPFSWGCIPLRHGQQFEDLTGHMYDTFKRLKSKEYGILPDQHYTWLGASPDGIITHVNEPTCANLASKKAKTNATDAASYTDRAMIGRMREIKNPVSRSITDKIPSYYYWQMLQQMYVCQLPICDFIQTLVKYPAQCEWDIFMKDTIPYELITDTTTWLEYQKLLSPYILENIDWAVMNQLLIRDNKLDDISSIDLTTVDNTLTTTLATHFQKITHIAPENINRRGQVKGILWCFIREDDAGETDFRVEFTSMDIAVNNEENIYQQECALKEKYNGFKLDDKHYWNVEEYRVIEVEYNQGLYEGLAKFCNLSNTSNDNHHKDNCIISRLQAKWNMIETLRAIDDMDAKRTKFMEFYPDPKEGEPGWRSDKNAGVTSGGKTAYGNAKYSRRNKSKQPRIRSAFKLD